MSDGAICGLYESACNRMDLFTHTHLALARLSREWLTDGADSLER